MRKQNRKFGTTALMTMLLFALACQDWARSMETEDMTEEVALDAYEAHLLSKGSTIMVAKLMREAIRLDDGQVLKFGPAGSFVDDAGVVRRISLPNGRDAVVAFGDTER